MKVLIANRGEISVRIARAVSSVGATPQQVFAASEQPPSDSAVQLPGTGVDAYLDVEGIIATALETGSDAVHPGYGFLSESPELAQACADAGLLFVGPSPSALELFGDKGSSIRHAKSVAVPVLDSTPSPASDDDIIELFAQHPSGIMIKAIAGGGGRGMRAVTSEDELAEAIASCRSEGMRAFGKNEVYAERLLLSARHIEIQVLGDGSSRAVAFAERDCSIQRRNQKVIEITPSPVLTDAQRERLMTDALALIEPLNYRGLATVEFLVDDAQLRQTGQLDYVFIEVNPRLQVEHTITEEVLGIDLVVAQLLVAAGNSLAELGFDVPQVLAPADRYAIQCRVNAERETNGVMSATTGTVLNIALPVGTRIDTHLLKGLVIDGTFDSLLAKVITVTNGSFSEACAEATAVLAEMRIDGVESNIGLLREILADPTVIEAKATTTYLDRYLEARAAASGSSIPGEASCPMAGTIVSIDVEVGTLVSARTTIATIEAMKMEHRVLAGIAGEVMALNIAVGEQVEVGQVVALISPGEEHRNDDGGLTDEIDLDHIRPDLAELVERIRLTRDEARPEAVTKRHSRGRLTTRESISALVDADSFIEYAALPVAAQRSRFSVEHLIKHTPADGLITGLARIDGGDCAVIAYDYTVMAGTQGYFNHKKTDRMIEVARKRKVPLVLFAEGGGGRPGDTDTIDTIAAGLNYPTFAEMGALSGEVPTVGIVGGRCFAGNAALLGCCDVIIATRDSSIGMAGPAMIEGGGLGSFTPEEVGPSNVQSPNGVIDILVEDDAEAIETARRYLSYFQGAQDEWSAADQRLLRHSIGENRKQVYNVRSLIETLADTDSVTEIRREFGPGIITALVRFEGRPMGLIANNPAHLGGAIDANGADKMARFLQLCDAHGLPIVSLTDTPGFMVGPDSEKTATVRHFSRLFVIASHLTVPMIAVVLRKGYGLGAMAMTAGGFLRTAATVSWPTGEFGPMGLEGGVRLGFAKEMAAIHDPEQREERFQELLTQQYENGKAINSAMTLEFDEVIDPVDTRKWIMAVVGDHDPSIRGNRYIDTW